MKPFQIFIFGIINFSLLMAWLLRFTRKHSRQFFYARKMIIRKQMSSSAKMLQEAKRRGLKIRKSIESIDREIDNRTQSILKTADEECSLIIDNAKISSKMIIENTIRQTEEERRRALLDVRNSILREAFMQTETAFKEGMTPEMKKSLVENGFSELPRIVKMQESQVSSPGGSK